MDNAAATVNLHSNPPGDALARQYLLWVDGVGVFLLCLEEEVSIGGHRKDEDRADVCLMSNLARKHAVIRRAAGDYHIEARGELTLNDRPLSEPGGTSALGPSAELVLGGDVPVRFRRPNGLSLTATLEFQSSYSPLAGQPPMMVDQVILMEQNCLIGPGADQHVRLDDCEEGVLLYRSKGRLWCKSRSSFAVNDKPVIHTSRLASGDVVAGRDFRFRLEALEPAEK